MAFVSLSIFVVPVLYCWYKEREWAEAKQGPDRRISDERRQKAAEMIESISVAMEKRFKQIKKTFYNYLRRNR